MPMSERYFRWVLGHPWTVVLLCLLAVAGLASGIPRLSFSNDYRMFFSEDNPQLRAFEALQNTYTKNDNVLFVIGPRDGDVFTRRTLADIEWLTKESWQIPHSIRVDSVTNFQHTEAEGDDLRVQDLVEEAQSLDQAGLAKVRRVALAEPLLVRRLISPDGAFTGVNVTIQLPGRSLNEVPEVVAFARGLAQRLRARNPDLEVRLTGMVVMNNSFAEASQGDMKTLYPLMFGVIFVTLALLLRSIPGTLTTLLLIVFTILATMGITGWLGIQLSPPTTSVPVVVMTLAVADCVHILVNFLHGLRMGEEKPRALLESLRINLGPVFLTSLTTAIGFMSLNFSDAPPFRDLGNMSAIGVSIAFLLSLSFLPATMMLLPVRASRGDRVGGRAMDRLGAFVVCRRRPLLWLGSAVIVLLVAQIPRNQLNDEFVKYFDASNPFRADTEYATDHLTGIYLVEFSVPAPGEGGVADPEYLRHLEAFADWFRRQPRVLHVNVLTDIMKRLNKNMHGDDPEWYRLPDDRELAAQYLLLYEFSLPFGLDLTNQINVKKSATRMTVTLENVSSNDLLRVEAEAQAWLRDHAPDYMRAQGVSPSVMFAHIGYRNIRSMLEGTSAALVLISAILIFALRSLRLGLISLIPNLVPIAMAFGVWGLLVGQVGLALSVVSGMTLGIVVDDTVHFLSKFLRARREKGLDAPDAVRYAFSTVGTALWVTSMVLVLGFSVLAFSGFELNAGMGKLTAITLTLALLADFLYLPPLLMTFGDPKHVKVPAADSVP